MTGLAALTFTADAAIYHVASYKYQRFQIPVVGDCNSKFEYECQRTAEEDWSKCENPFEYTIYCSPQEKASGKNNPWNLNCADGLKKRRICSLKREFDLQICTLEYGCAPGNVCTRDVHWVRSFPGAGTC